MRLSFPIPTIVILLYRGHVDVNVSYRKYRRLYTTKLPGLAHSHYVDRDGCAHLHSNFQTANVSNPSVLNPSGPRTTRIPPDWTVKNLILLRHNSFIKKNVTEKCTASR